MIIKIGNKDFNLDGYANINEIARAVGEVKNKAYEQGRADAIEEVIEVLKGIDSYVADLVEEIFRLKEQKNMVYESPCNPCEYNYYSVDEFGDCKEDICRCPENEKAEKCWIEQWAREKAERGRE